MGKVNRQGYPIWIVWNRIETNGCAYSEFSWVRPH